MKWKWWKLLWKLNLNINMNMNHVPQTPQSPEETPCAAKTRRKAVLAWDCHMSTKPTEWLCLQQGNGVRAVHHGLPSTHQHSRAKKKKKLVRQRPAWLWTHISREQLLRSMGTQFKRSPQWLFLEVKSNREVISDAVFWRTLWKPLGHLPSHQDHLPWLNRQCLLLHS